MFYLGKEGHPFAGSQVHVIHVNLARLVPKPWPLLDSSLFCCPSIPAQALRAAIVAAELPLRGKLYAEATIFFIDKRILEVLYEQYMGDEIPLREVNEIPRAPCNKSSVFNNNFIST